MCRKFYQVLFVIYRLVESLFPTQKIYVFYDLRQANLSPEVKPTKKKEEKMRKYLTNFLSSVFRK